MAYFFDEPSRTFGEYLLVPGFSSGDCIPVTVPAGYCYVVFPEDAHAPGKHLDAPLNYTKIVVKLAL